MEAIRTLLEPIISSPGRLELILVLLKILRIIAVTFILIFILDETTDLDQLGADIWGHNTEFRNTWLFAIMAIAGALLCVAIIFLTILH